MTAQQAAADKQLQGEHEIWVLQTRVDTKWTFGKHVRTITNGLLNQMQTVCCTAHQACRISIITVA
jgi:hypothetical protein